MGRRRTLPLWMTAVVAAATLSPSNHAFAAVESQAGSCVGAGQGGQLLQATYYEPALQSQVMANGRAYDARNPLLAASNSYRLGTILRVRQADGAGTVVVEVADRGGAGLQLDLSEAAFTRLAPLDAGRVPVCVETLN